MLKDYNTRTGNYPSESSDIAIRLKVLAGEIFSSYMNLEFIKNQIFAETATGKYLDYHGIQRGLTRKSAIKAKGIVNFGTTYAVLRAITIPKGTIVSTAGEDPILFETDEDAILPADQVRVSVNCTAAEGGSRGNVKANSISVIATPVNGISLVSNTSAFRGGTDDESDEELRKRIKDTVINVSNGANLAYYKKLVLNIEGVDSVGIIPQNRGVGTVDIFIGTKGKTATPELVSEVQNLIDEYKEINVDVLVQSAEVWNFTMGASVKVKPGYDFNEIKQTLNDNIKNFVASLGVGKDVNASDIAEIIYHTEGVENYFLSFSDKIIQQNQYANLSSINITEKE